MLHAMHINSCFPKFRIFNQIHNNLFFLLSLACNEYENAMHEVQARRPRHYNNVHNMYFVIVFYYIARFKPKTRPMKCQTI
jgi:hypothetical protein